MSGNILPESYITPTQVPRKNMCDSNSDSMEIDSMEVVTSCIGIPQSILDQKTIELFEKEHFVAKSDRAQVITETSTDSSNEIKNVDNTGVSKGINADAESDDEEGNSNNCEEAFGKLTCSTCNCEFSINDDDACSSFNGILKCSACYYF